MPGAGHIVHMPAHIYLRVGKFRESLAVNKRAIAVDERYFAASPPDPLYRAAYYPHNIHFAMVSAQMGGDGRTAVDAAGKLDAAVPVDVVRVVHRRHQHAMRAHSRTRRRRTSAPREARSPRSATIERSADFKPFTDWGVPAKDIVQTARLVATGRLAAAQGDLDAAAKAYADAIFIEHALAYTEPPYWYYPVRQSLGSVLLRQGRLDEAERAFRESLARVRGNGWALAGLAGTYRRKGDAAAERNARRAYAKAWFGAAGGPPLAAL